MTFTGSVQDFCDEEWRTVRFKDIHPDERYEVSNHGRIRLFKPETETWRILKTANVGGYRYFSFKSSIHWKVRKTKAVHRLVAQEFCENKSLGRFVIHLDYDKANNYHRNLKWVNQKELTEHNKANPNVKNAVRKNVITNQKLTETDVIRLKKKLLRGNNKLYKLAKEFGITHTQLNRIRKGENWAHVKVS